MLRLRHFIISGIIAIGLSCVCVVAQESDGDLDTQIENVRDAKWKKELKALQDAASIMETVSDEKSAEKAAGKLRQMFRNLPPPVSGDQKTIELWARAQNRVSAHMWRLLKESYFISSGLQEAWTLITDPFSRRSAN